MREFVGQRILQGQTPTPENIAQGAYMLIREMRPHFDIMVCPLHFVKSNVEIIPNIDN
jgi:hypothetical protein